MHVFGFKGSSVNDSLFTFVLVRPMPPPRYGTSARRWSTEDGRVARASSVGSSAGRYSARASSPSHCARDADEARSPFQCDLCRPACGQCRRAGVSCSGYRDLSELRFVNERKPTENTRVVREVLALPHCPQEAEDVDAQQRLLDRSLPSHSPRQGEQSVPPSMTVHASSLAVSAFIQHCICYPRELGGNRQGLFNPSIYAAHIYSPALLDVMAATGSLVMGVKEDLECVKFYSFSRSRYTSALQSVRASLPNAQSAKSDETLLAVMLLACYEVT